MAPGGSQALPLSVGTSMNEPQIDLTEEDSGTERLVHVGEVIQISLAENPTTGYRWQPEVDTAALRLTHDNYVGNVVPRGAGGTRMLKVVAIRPGALTLRLVKRRSWDQSVAAEFSLRLRVVVDEPDDPG